MNGFLNPITNFFKKGKESTTTQAKQEQSSQDDSCKVYVWPPFSNDENGEDASKPQALKGNRNFLLRSNDSDEYIKYGLDQNLDDTMSLDETIHNSYVHAYPDIDMMQAKLPPNFEYKERDIRGAGNKSESDSSFRPKEELLKPEQLEHILNSSILASSQGSDSENNTPKAQNSKKKNPKEMLASLEISSDNAIQAKSMNSSRDTQMHYGQHFRRKGVGNNFEILVGGGQTPKSVQINHEKGIIADIKPTKQQFNENEMPNNINNSHHVRQLEANDDLQNYSQIIQKVKGHRKFGNHDASLTESDDQNIVGLIGQLQERENLTPSPCESKFVVMDSEIQIQTKDFYENSINGGKNLSPETEKNMIKKEQDIITVSKSTAKANQKEYQPQELIGDLLQPQVYVIDNIESSIGENDHSGSEEFFSFPPSKKFSMQQSDIIKTQSTIPEDMISRIERPGFGQAINFVANQNEQEEQKKKKDLITATMTSSSGSNNVTPVPKIKIFDKNQKILTADLLDNPQISDLAPNLIRHTMSPPNNLGAQQMYDQNLYNQGEFLTQKLVQNEPIRSTVNLHRQQQYFETDKKASIVSQPLRREQSYQQRPENISHRKLTSTPAHLEQHSYEYQVGKQQNNHIQKYSSPPQQESQINRITPPQTQMNRLTPQPSQHKPQMSLPTQNSMQKSSPSMHQHHKSTANFPTQSQFESVADEYTYTQSPYIESHQQTQNNNFTKSDSKINNFLTLQSPSQSKPTPSKYFTPNSQKQQPSTDRGHYQSQSTQFFSLKQQSPEITDFNAKLATVSAAPPSQSRATTTTPVRGTLASDRVSNNNTAPNSNPTPSRVRRTVSSLQKPTPKKSYKTMPYIESFEHENSGSMNSTKQSSHEKRHTLSNFQPKSSQPNSKLRIKSLDLNNLFLKSPVVSDRAHDQQHQNTNSYGYYGPASARDLPLRSSINFEIIEDEDEHQQTALRIIESSPKFPTRKLLSDFQQTQPSKQEEQQQEDDQVSQQQQPIILSPLQTRDSKEHIKLATITTKKQDQQDFDIVSSESMAINPGLKASVGIRFSHQEDPSLYLGHEPTRQAVRGGAGDRTDLFSNISAINEHEITHNRDSVAYDIGVGDINSKIQNTYQSFLNNAQKSKKIVSQYAPQEATIIFQYIEIAHEKIIGIFQNDSMLAKLKIDIKSLQSTCNELKNFQQVPSVSGILCNLGMIDLYSSEKEGIISKFGSQRQSILNSHQKSLKSSISTPNIHSHTKSCYAKTMLPPKPYQEPSMSKSQIPKLNLGQIQEKTRQLSEMTQQSGSSRLSHQPIFSQPQSTEQNRQNHPTGINNNTKTEFAKTFCGSLNSMAQYGTKSSIVEMTSEEKRSNSSTLNEQAKILTQRKRQMSNYKQMQQKFQELAVNMKNKLPKDHPAVTLMISDMFESMVAENIEEYYWKQFIQDQFDNYTGESVLYSKGFEVY